MSDMTQEFSDAIRQMTKPELERFALECRGMGIEDMADATEALAEVIAVD